MRDANTAIYHMYASEISNFCGINTWLGNIFVRHATSSDPLSEPFLVDDDEDDDKKAATATNGSSSVVNGVFSHEPAVFRAPNGSFVLFFAAVYGEANPPTYKGTCEACSDGISDSSCGNDQDRNESTSLPTYIVLSDSLPTGPWSEPAQIPGTDTDVDSNFSPAINANGSLTALTRNDVWFASDWSNVSSYAIVNTQWCEDGEDPFLWVDGRGVYHCLVHVNREETYGVHYWSLDGVGWQATSGGGQSLRVGGAVCQRAKHRLCVQGAAPCSDGRPRKGGRFNQRSGVRLSPHGGAERPLLHAPSNRGVKNSTRVLE